MNLMARPRGNSSYITGEDQQYGQIANVIRGFQPSELAKNESFLKEKILKNQGFTRNLFQKRDFPCLAKILQTNFGTFRQRMQQHGELQTHFSDIYTENKSRQQRIDQLRQQLREAQQENERLKSKILSVHEQNIKVYEDSQREPKRVVIQEQAGRVGSLPSQKQNKLKEKEDKYVGYRESDLPALRKVGELTSFIDQHHQSPLIRLDAFTGFGEEYKPDMPTKKAPPPPSPLKKNPFAAFGDQYVPEEANPKILSKFLGENGVVKNQSCMEMEESLIYSHLRLKGEIEEKRANSQPKKTNAKMEQLLLPQTGKTTKKIQVNMGKQLGNPEEKPAKPLIEVAGSLQSKYIEEKNNVMNPHEEDFYSGDFQVMEMKHERAIKKEMFKNSLRKK